MSANRHSGTKAQRQDGERAWAGLEAMEPRLLLSSVFYLSTTSLESGLVPTPVNPEVSVEVGQSVTLYLWVSMASGTSTQMGWDLVESNSGAIERGTVELWNDLLDPLGSNPQYPSPDDVCRWDDWNVTEGMDGDALGFRATAAPPMDPSDWPDGVGLTTNYRTDGDPSVRGSTSPYQVYVGAVSFTGAKVGQTDMFLTVNDTQTYGDSRMIGTPASPGLKIGAGEGSYAPVSSDAGTYYVAPGVTGTLADARITVVPSSSTRPTIGSVSTDAELVWLADDFKLMANGVGDSDDTVSEVRFYQENNGIPGLQVGSDAAYYDTFVGMDTNGGSGWSLLISKAGLTAGNYTYYAQAIDDDGQVSSAGTLAPARTVSVDAALQYPLTADPQAVTRPGELTLRTEHPEGWMYWGRQLGSSAEDGTIDNGKRGAGGSLAVDAAGNIFVGGSTKGALGGENAGGWDVFLAKYDSGGSLMWVRQFGTSGDDTCTDVGVDQNGNLLLTGTMTSYNAINAFTAKCDTDGNLLWMQQMSGLDSWGGGVASDAGGNVLIAGCRREATNYQFDIVVAKYDAAGNLMWQRQFGTATFNDYGNGIATDAEGNAYVTGMESIWGSNAFVSKFDAAGNQVWTQYIGIGYGYGVTTDAAGAIVVTGETGLAIGGPKAGDVLVAKYDSGGSQLWVRQWGSKHNEYGYNVTTDAESNIFVGGLTNYGDGESLLAKYDAQGNLVWTQILGTAVIERRGDVALNPDGEVYFSGLTNGCIGGVNAGSYDVFLARIAEPESVSFYRGSNGVAGLQAGGDTLVGTDTSGGDGWSAAVATEGLEGGKYAFYAQGTDSAWGNSAIMSVGVTVYVRGDVNRDGAVNSMDISAFVSALTRGPYQAEADCDKDGLVNALDIDGFVALLISGGEEGDGAMVGGASGAEMMGEAGWTPGIEGARLVRTLGDEQPVAVGGEVLPETRGLMAKPRLSISMGRSMGGVGMLKHAGAWANMTAGGWGQGWGRGRTLAVLEDANEVDVLAMLG